MKRCKKSRISTIKKNIILIVDDNPNNIKLIAGVLSEFDFQIVYAKSGEKYTDEY